MDSGRCRHGHLVDYSRCSREVGCVREWNWENTILYFYTQTHTHTPIHSREEEHCAIFCMLLLRIICNITHKYLSLGLGALVCCSSCLLLNFRFSHPLKKHDSIHNNKVVKGAFRKGIYFACGKNEPLSLDMAMDRTHNVNILYAAYIRLHADKMR